ncbi:hypothetical protein GGI25_002879 [Coemansia spiralis]|uniref:PB1 domain-containing protein n=2 Tax=Coemansia TaxID=4863 RepID=A0A9W8G7R7_9FUNG|nr:hypothetical protein EDC05_002850 [Coemansia umbellata]KAJ2622266.1 hypothetical protein GGI26_003419 [Coemansia sp. RSA 1358]KAJ2677781.1 hypothetical protein GGI25_002879 [Coemansia spiralis]
MTDSSLSDRDAPLHDPSDATMSRSLRERVANKLGLGKGGNKARRGSTPRTSLIPVNGTQSPAKSIGSHDMEQLNDRLQRLKADGATDPISVPFRVKFVNSKGEATMADVYPTEEFKDIVQKVTEKLRMSRRSDYVLMYKDTDDEEIGVACTDNLREMFSIFEPGSRLQLRIVPFNIINSGALDSIAKIWEYGQTPNVFISDPNMPSSASDAGSDASSVSVNLTKITLETQKQQPEMAEKPKPAAVEDVVDAATAAVAATVAQSTKSDATSHDAVSSTKTQPPTPVPSPPKQTPVLSPKLKTQPSTPVQSPKTKDAEELRQAIMLMSANLTLAIESLGTKLTRNFDKLSTEQAKIIDTLGNATKLKEENVAITEAKTEEVKVNGAVAGKEEQITATTTTITTAVKDDVVEEKVEEADVAVGKVDDVGASSLEDIKVTIEDRVEVEKAEETKTEVKVEEVKVEEAKVEEIKIAEVKVEEVKTEAKTETTTEIKTEELKTEGTDETKIEKIETKVETTTTKEEPANGKKKHSRQEVKFAVEEDRDSDDETIHVEVIDETQSVASASSFGSNGTKMNEKIDIKVTENVPAASNGPKKEKVNIKVTESVPASSTSSCGSNGTKERINIKVTENVPSHKTRTERIRVHVEEPVPNYGFVNNKKATEAFAYHLSAANFAFHSNPYSSSFFKHGFAEAGIPSHFAHPCMMTSPFECVSGCSCTHNQSCSFCANGR